MKKFIRNFIEKGVNPLLLYSGFVLPGQVINVLEKQFPYIEFTLEGMDDEDLRIIFNFGDFEYRILFCFTTHKESGIHYINNIFVLFDEELVEEGEKE